MSWVQQPTLSAANQPSQLQQQQQQSTPESHIPYQEHLHQQKQLQHLQQQQHQQGSTITSKTAFSQMLAPPSSLPNAALNNVNNYLHNHMQQSTAAHFNPPPLQQMSEFKTQVQQQLPQQVSQQKQLNTWQQHQQQNYQQNLNNMMDPATANVNTWSQQQPNNMGQHAQNAAYQQQNTTNWSQPPPIQQQQATNYENYFVQDQTKQQQPLQQVYQQNDLNVTTNQQQTTSQQQQPQKQQQHNYNDFFDNNSANNNNATNNSINKSGDGWGDWGDWNDNSMMNSNNEPNEQLTIEQTQQQSINPNVNPIEDSFNTQNNNTNNDTWQWNKLDNAAKSQVIATEAATAAQISIQNQQVPTNQTIISKQTNLQQNYSPQTPVAAQQMLQQLPQQQYPQQHKTADFAVVTSKATKTVSSIKPPNSLPLNAFVNEATESSPTTANIPNSVYLTQAKPVTRPPRQFASPPTGNTPIESPENSLLLPQPPQAFQNERTPLQNDMAAPAKAAMALPPAPPILSSATSAPTAAATSTSNPFKRTGAVKHHRADLLPTSTASSFGVPPPPADFANPLSISAPTHLQPDNSEIFHENQEVLKPPPVTLPSANFIALGTEQATVVLQSSLPLLNAERNQYMQTSQLSEHQDDEFNLEVDSLPPPGLSRLVLGEPELESANQRLVTGTEEPIALGNMALASLNMEERHADGEDTSVDQATNIVPLLSAPIHRGTSSIGADNIAADRNLYEVPGESDLITDRRIVPGVETVEAITLPTVAQVPVSPPQVRSDQREVELDGENLEDEQPTSSIAAVSSRNEPPLEGAVASGQQIAVPPTVETIETRPYDKHQSKSSTGRSQSNASTGNESDFELIEHQQSQQPQQHSQRYKSLRSALQKHGVDRRTETQRREKQRSVERSFGSEEASVEYSTDQERERRRGDHENDDRQRERQRKRDKREHLSGAEREHDRHYKSSGPNATSRSDFSRRSVRGNGARDGQRSERDRDRDREFENPHRRPNKYEKDSRGNERVDDGREPRDARDKRDRRAPPRRSERDTRGDYNNIERQRRRGDRNQTRDYDEYRKQSSRNARESDVEKEQQRYARNNPLPDPRYDPQMLYGFPNPSQYDPYKYYYETLARTNPQAYHEWYKKYYEQQKQLMAAMSVGQQAAGGNTASAADNMSVNATVGAGNSSFAATDGRESVHSGRSSAHNEKDRYTKAYISQANQYHQRHYQQNVQFHHSQQLPQQQQHYNQQQPFNRSLNAAAAAYHSQNFALNSTFLGDAASLASFGSYSRGGRLSAAHSVDNLSSISSTAFKPISGHYSNKAGTNAKYGSLDRYADSRSIQPSLRDGEPVAALEQHRSTPLQFASLHTLVSMSSGILVTIKPRVSSKGHLNNIAKLQRLGINDANRQLYQSFPGPLVRGLTHKKTIIDFCEEQIRLGPTETTIYARQLTPRSVEKYRASYTLMWNLLILLLRQNGMVVGTDIAELLLKNQQEFPYQSGISSQSGSHRRLNLISDDETSENSLEAIDSKTDENDIVESEVTKAKQHDGDEANSEENKNTENIADSTPTSITQLSEIEVTEKFRNYLLYGNVNEALDWATDNNLWGHALFLASKVDRRSHANVMMKFANKLSLNDPLQTLYQLMSGRTPSSVTSVQDEKWGDWRPHLSMILSNTSQKPELDRKAITTLGDSLFNRGDLYAAHFCYLMAQVGFGRYQESAVQETSLQQNLPKLVLLGSSHYKNFRDFACNEAIMMTEIYEYACSLNDEKFSLIEFQPYKYLLATRLLDYGFNLKSLMYMEQISLHIARDPSRYEASFINKVFEIADRLKYFDPVLEKTLDDQQQSSLEGNTNTDLSNAMPQNFEEQKWLQTLRSIALQYKLDYPVPTASYPSHDYTPQQQQQNEQHQLDSNYMQNQINQEFAEINKQFSELNLQYTNSEQSPAFYNPEAPTQSTNLEQTNQQSQDYSQCPAGSLPPQTIYSDYGSTLATQEQPQHAAVGNTGATVPASAEAANADPYANYTAQHQQQQQASPYYNPNAQQQAYDAYGQQNTAGYNDYWSQQQQQQQFGDENVRPMISMPKSKTYDSDDDKQTKQQEQLQQTAANQAKKGANATAAQPNNNEGKISSKSGQQTNTNSGWFGGIWNKLSLKPKNQMILPDDKNPTIVWDAEKKRWVNTDGDETAEESLKPPPKMSDIMQQQPPQMMSQPQQQPPPQMMTQPQQQPQLQQIPQQQQMPEAANQLQTMTVPLSASSPLTNYNAQGPTPAAAAVSAPATVNSAPKQPSLQSNMFKMQRNRTLKNAYVDVFNPSGAPMSKAAENVLAPVLPPAAVPQSGFFVPDGSAPNDPNAGYQQQQQQAEAPQFYNPSQYGGGGY